MEENKVYSDLSEADSLDIAKEAALTLLRKQAKELCLYQVKDTSVITDYYIIVTGRSSTHVKALSDELAEEMGKHKVPAARVEGRDGAAWILVDFGCVIAHIFDRQSREYYHLERLLRPEDALDTAELEAAADKDTETV